MTTLGKLVLMVQYDYYCKCNHYGSTQRNFYEVQASCLADEQSYLIGLQYSSHY
jgi:hypothetical protein